MSYKKPFFVTLTAIILMCSIPISASALSPFDSELDYYTYNNANVSTANSPWFDVYINNQHIVGKVHTRGGSVYGCFILFIPFMGYYLVVRQSGSLRVDGTSGSANYIYYAWGNDNGYYPNATRGYQGDGFLTSSNVNLFQDVFFGEYWVFFRIITSSDGSPSSTVRSSLSSIDTPTPSQEDNLKQYLNNQSGQGKPLPSGAGNSTIIDGSKTIPTNPNGTPIPTDSNGNPVPTDANGNPVPTDSSGNPVPTDANGRPVATNSAGNPVPTYPDGRPRETFPNGTPVPTDSAGYPLPTFTTPDGTTWVSPEGYEPVTDPDTGVPVTDPATHAPVFEEVTIYNDENGKSDINGEFSKIYGMISDLDNLSSLAESNQAILSSHVADTNNLITNITSWLPTPVLACLVCGAIMIIAVKITGSGKS